MTSGMIPNKLNATKVQRFISRYWEKRQSNSLLQKEKHRNPSLVNIDKTLCLPMIVRFTKLQF